MYGVFAFLASDIPLDKLEIYCDFERDVMTSLASRSRIVLSKLRIEPISKLHIILSARSFEKNSSSRSDANYNWNVLRSAEIGSAFVVLVHSKQNDV
jgi:hypothetical protein